MPEETSIVQVLASQNGSLANPGCCNECDHCTLVQLGTCLVYCGCMYTCIYGCCSLFSTLCWSPADHCASMLVSLLISSCCTWTDGGVRCWPATGHDPSCCGHSVTVWEHCCIGCGWTELQYSSCACHGLGVLHTLLLPQATWNVSAQWPTSWGSKLCDMYGISGNSGLLYVWVLSWVLKYLITQVLKS